MLNPLISRVHGEAARPPGNDPPTRGSGTVTARRSYLAGAETYNTYAGGGGSGVSHVQNCASIGGKIAIGMLWDERRRTRCLTSNELRYRESDQQLDP